MIETPAGIERRVARWRPALAGVLAAGLGLGVAELLAGVLGRATTPVLGVGEAVIDRTPVWLVELAISWFGTRDKDVLIAGVLVVLAALAAGAGLLAAWRRAAGVAAAAALGVVAAVAVWSRPDTSATDLLPVVVGFAAAAFALDRLVASAVAADPPISPRDLEGDVPVGPVVPGRDRRREPAPAQGRRQFIRLAVLAGVAAAAAGGIGRMLGARRMGVESSRDEVDAVSLPRPLPVATPPTGADLEVRGAEPWLTPNPDFYRIDTVLSPPLLTAADWRLRVHGLVEREVTLDFDDLVRVGLVDRWVTLVCVSNNVGGDLIGNAFWTGVPIADVLGMAGPLPEADAVLSTSQDGWTCGTPLGVLTDGRDALFAVGMNGEPLPVEHGFPVRMVVPGLYGYVSATKWVVDVEVSRFDRFEAYWTSRGWSERAPVKVQSRIDVPRRDVSVAAGRVPVAGVAWAQHRGIAAVEVRVDGGPWQRAEIAEVPSADTWRQWVWQWDAEPGRHRLEVRATTADGEVQTEAVSPPAPDGATGWHGVDVEVTA